MDQQWTKGQPSNRHGLWQELDVELHPIVNDHEGRSLYHHEHADSPGVPTSRGGHEDLALPHVHGQDLHVMGRESLGLEFQAESSRYGPVRSSEKLPRVPSMPSTHMASMHMSASYGMSAGVLPFNSSSAVAAGVTPWSLGAAAVAAPMMATTHLSAPADARPVRGLDRAPSGWHDTSARRESGSQQWMAELALPRTPSMSMIADPNPESVSMNRMMATETFRANVARMSAGAGDSGGQWQLPQPQHQVVAAVPVPLLTPTAYGYIAAGTSLDAPDGTALISVATPAASFRSPLPLPVAQGQQVSTHLVPQLPPNHIRSGNNSSWFSDWRFSDSHLSEPRAAVNLQGPSGQVSSTHVHPQPPIASIWPGAETVGSGSRTLHLFPQHPKGGWCDTVMADSNSSAPWSPAAEAPEVASARGARGRGASGRGRSRGRASEATQDRGRKQGRRRRLSRGDIDGVGGQSPNPPPAAAEASSTEHASHSMAMDKLQPEPLRDSPSPQVLAGGHEFASGSGLRTPQQLSFSNMANLSTPAPAMGNPQAAASNTVGVRALPKWFRRHVFSLRMPVGADLSFTCFAHRNHLHNMRCEGAQRPVPPPVRSVGTSADSGLINVWVATQHWRCPVMQAVDADAKWEVHLCHETAARQMVKLLQEKEEGAEVGQGRPHLQLWTDSDTPLDELNYWYSSSFTVRGGEERCIKHAFVFDKRMPTDVLDQLLRHALDLLRLWVRCTKYVEPEVAKAGDAEAGDQINGSRAYLCNDEIYIECPIPSLWIGNVDNTLCLTVARVTPLFTQRDDEIS